MKQNRIIIVAALLGTLAFASCKKDYTCTCTTVVATGSTTETHSISNETYNEQNVSAIIMKTRQIAHYLAALLVIYK